VCARRNYRFAKRTLIDLDSSSSGCNINFTLIQLVTVINSGVGAAHSTKFSRVNPIPWRISRLLEPWIWGSVAQTVVGDVTPLAGGNDRNNVETRPRADAIYVSGSTGLTFRPRSRERASARAFLERREWLCKWYTHNVCGTSRFLHIRVTESTREAPLYILIPVVKRASYYSGKKPRAHALRLYRRVVSFNSKF